MHEFELDGMFAAETASSSGRGAAQHRVGVAADVVEVHAVLAQRCDPESRNPVTSTARVAWGEPLKHTTLTPLHSSQLSSMQLGKDPTVRGVAHCVEDREADVAMVRHVERRSTPREVTVDRQQNFGAMPADRSGEITP